MADTQRSRELQQERSEQDFRRRIIIGSQPTHLDLFSGIGGFALAAQWAGFRTIGFCEIDKYCRKVLAKNFLADAYREFRSEGWKSGRGQQPRHGESVSETVIHSNIFDLNGADFAGVSLITGGFPCQPFSVAGKRRGAADDRAIWPEMFRVISEARPAWVLGENVPGIIPMELDNVLSDLEGIGYATRAFVVPACAVDARHRRDRLWVVANANGDESGRTLRGSNGESDCVSGIHRQDDSSTRESCGTGFVADAGGEGLEGRKEALRPQEGRNGNTRHDWQSIGGERRNCEWLPEPDVGRVAHGIPSRVDRLKGLGNAIVPQVAYEILREIRKLC